MSTDFQNPRASARGAVNAKIFDLVTYRAAHPGSAVRMQVHFAPLWPVQFWIAFWREVMAVGLPGSGR